MLTVMFLVTACGDHPAPGPDAAKANAAPQSVQRKVEPPQQSPAAHPKESVKPKERPPKTPPNGSSIEDTTPDNFVEIDWGREVSLDEIMGMAKSGRIQEIEWHVMPNIIRILTVDGKVFHLRNEDKGIDIRNTLINAGIRIGKDGINLRHVF